MENTNILPLLFEPNLHETVWGGDKLCQWKGLDAHSLPVGESWEVSAVPSSINMITNGPFAGRDLVSLIEEYPIEILGASVAEKYNNKLPLLVKFIDAHRDLSIQVHPNDEMAKRVHGKFGKSEMWYVIDAEPGAYLYAGFSHEINPDEYRRRIADGTITEVLAKHEVKAGDVFYLPAGRVHAICSGILLAEVQQSSDLTYRIFDYNRPGMDGKPRELHTDLAAEALDFHVEDDYRTRYVEVDNRANSVLATPYFSVRVVDTEEPFHRDLIKYDSFIISMCLKGSCKIRIRSNGQEVELKEGYSCLIPAVIADYDILPVGNCKLLDAYIDNKQRDLGSAISRFLHLSKK
jgi:mannose-6-phosphate isomerase